MVQIEVTEFRCQPGHNRHSNADLDSVPSDLALAEHLNITVATVPFDEREGTSDVATLSSRIMPPSKDQSG